MEDIINRIDGQVQVIFEKTDGNQPIVMQYGCQKKNMPILLVQQSIQLNKKDLIIG